MAFAKYVPETKKSYFNFMQLGFDESFSIYKKYFSFKKTIYAMKLHFLLNVSIDNPIYTLTIFGLWKVSNIFSSIRLFSKL